MTATEAVKQVPERRHYINGKYVSSGGDASIEVRNPATGELLATVPDATAADAIARLRMAYGSRLGLQFEHVGSAAERGWFRDAVEHGPYLGELTEKGLDRDRPGER